MCHIVMTHMPYMSFSHPWHILSKIEKEKNECKSESSKSDVPK